MRRTASTGLMFLLALLLTDSAAAQDAYLDEWRDLRSANPAELSFAISTKKLTFFLGEMTSLQLTYSATKPNDFLVETRLQDRIGRVNGADEFRIAGDSPTEDPLHGLQGEAGGLGGVSGGSVLLPDKPFTLELALNEWVRLRSPGTYRLFVITHRISHAQQPLPNPPLLPRRGSPVTVVSNVLTIEVLPAPDGWVKEQIAAASKILDRPVTPEDSYQERVDAGRVLSFLNTREAVFELARLLGDGRDVNSVGLHRAILGSPFRSDLLPFLEERLVAPDQPVWDQYLETLAHLAELVASGGPLRPYPQDEQERAAWQEESKRRTEVQRQKREQYVGRLIDSLPTKQPEPRAVSLTTLINIAINSASRPTWYPRISSALVANFRALPSKMQSEWLETRWAAIKGPEMIPVLREIYSNAPLPRIDPPADELALRRLYELAPAEGKRLLLEEIEHPTRFMRWTTLSMLTESSLPELNDVLAVRLESSEPDERLIVRYATGEILPRVKSYYERDRAFYARRNAPMCLHAVLFYFLKYDPQYGERELRRLLDGPAAAPACHNLAWNDLGAYAMSPALERLASEYLTSPSVLIKSGAAELLGKYGSAGAQKPLWDTMIYFHQYWEGKEQELQSNQEGVQFERTLRIALAQADGWVFGGQELNRLLTLCITAWCRQDVGMWIQQANAPVQVQILLSMNGVRFVLAQYDNLSEEQFQKKLAQVPRATSFRIAPLGNENILPELRAARERAERAISAASHKVIP